MEQALIDKLTGIIKKELEQGDIFRYINKLTLHEGEVVWDQGWYGKKPIDKYTLAGVAEDIAQEKVIDSINSGDLVVTPDMFLNSSLKKNAGLARRYSHSCETEINLVYILTKCIKANDMDLAIQFKHDLNWMRLDGLVEELDKNLYKLSAEGKALLYRYYAEQDGKEYYKFIKEQL